MNDRPQDTTVTTRRAFLKNASVALLATHPAARALAGAMAAQPGGQDEALLAIPIKDPQQAKDLLRNKIDVLLKSKAFMADLKKRFDVPRFVPFTFTAETIVHNQINRVVDEEFDPNYTKEIKWKTGDPLTVGTLSEHYKARLTRSLYDNYSDFAKNYNPPKDPESRKKYELDMSKKYHAIETIIGCTLAQQFGYTESDDQWRHIPTGQRAALNFEHAMQELGVNPSPFIITAQDLQKVGIDVEEELKKLRNAPAAPKPWIKKVEHPQTAAKSH